MKRVLLILVCALSMGLFYSCSEDLGVSGIDVPEFNQKELSPTDLYIYKNYTKPYNVEVIYRWKDSETDVAKNLVPPEEDKVEPFLEILKTVWVDPYVEEAGSNFLKGLIPKQILLIGSASYNPDETITQGTAEGGRKMVLYEINSFSSQNVTKLKRFIHVMHHEFAHIMHQQVDYSRDYRTITTGYSSSWYLRSNEYAQERGFITNYAMSAPDEDFVEMIATMLTNNKRDWDIMINNIKSTDARTALRKKEAIVVGYLKDVWEIDLYHFQAKMDEVIKNVVLGDY